MSTFTESLRARGEAGLARVLVVRPDLAAPPPSSLRSLAARAANRVSLDRALAQLDGQCLQVLEAVLALDGTVTHPHGVRAEDVAVAVGGRATAGPPSDQPPPDLHESLRTCLDHALLWVAEPDVDLLRPAPGLDEVLGPYPAGLGPLLTATLGRRTAGTLTALAAELGIDDGTGTGTADGAAPADALPRRLAAHLAGPGTVAALLPQGPPGARAILEALAWGPPVGRSPAGSSRTGGTGAPSSPAGTAVDWLLHHGLLAVGDPQHVVLPREIALVLRGGRTHRELSAPPRPAGTPVDPRTVDAESARQAEEAVRLVAALIEQWGHDQPAVLRSGGLGSRDLRRLALRLEVPDATAALVVELAGAAGLVVDDGEPTPTFCPTTSADDWLRLPLPERWQQLAEAWSGSERAAWLVGTRDDKGALRAALDPESRRPWAPRLRAAVLAVLDEVRAEADPDDPDASGAAPRGLTAADVHAVLQWRTPRSAPALHAVEAVLHEADRLGIVTAGTVSAAGRALTTPPAARTDPPAQVLARHLPQAVDEILLQGDLTGIVPGRPSPELADLLERSAQVESRGAGLTVRFTEASVRSALDSGRPAESLLADLSRHARSGVPQPLEYLVLDVARRHGQVRVGMASSYLRADDPTLLAGLTEDRALRGLGLLQLAPTVLAAQVPPSTLLTALRERGLSPVAEDTGGVVVLTDAAPRRVRPHRAGTRAPARSASSRAEAEETLVRRATRVVRDLLRDQARADAAPPAPPGVDPGRGAAEDAVPDGDRDRADERGAAVQAGGHDAGHDGPDPVLALDLLREAVGEQREVWIDMVGPGGATTRRKVRPIRVDAGRVRVIDAERESELTIAVHRIADVAPV